MFVGRRFHATPIYVGAPAHRCWYNIGIKCLTPKPVDLIALPSLILKYVSALKSELGASIGYPDIVRQMASVKCRTQHVQAAAIRIGQVLSSS